MSFYIFALGYINASPAACALIKEITSLGCLCMYYVIAMHLSTKMPVLDVFGELEERAEMAMMMSNRLLYNSTMM